MSTVSLNKSISFHNPTILNACHSDEMIPQIYVACLSSYVNGKLYGAWVNADQDADSIHQDIAQMLAKSPMPGAEEWAIHNFQGFEGLQIEEHESLESVAEKAAFILEHGALGGELVSYYGGCLEDAQNALENYYHGSYESELDYATNLFDDLYLDLVPEPVKSYIDYQYFARDIFIDDYFSLEVQGKTHVFSRW